MEKTTFHIGETTISRITTSIDYPSSYDMTEIDKIYSIYPTADEIIMTPDSVTFTKDTGVCRLEGSKVDRIINSGVLNYPLTGYLYTTAVHEYINATKENING